jgi:protein-tyrosine-phosphatase
MVEQNTRRTVEFSPGSYLDRVGHGLRGAYVRSAIDRWLEELSSGVRLLQQGRTLEEIAELVRAGDLPASQFMAGPLATLSTPEFDAVVALCEECKLTGMEPGEVLAELVAGAHA